MLLGATAAQETYFSSCSDGWGVDARGDGCDWYNNELMESGLDYCGDYDSDDFQASNECCLCGGGNQCNDGAGVDAGGDGCDWYSENLNSCGDFDTADFVAAEQCCSCGGGSDVCWDGEGTDSSGDSCKWYNTNLGDGVCDG